MKNISDVTFIDFGLEDVVAFTEEQIHDLDEKTRQTPAFKLVQVYHEIFDSRINPKYVEPVVNDIVEEFVDDTTLTTKHAKAYFGALVLKKFYTGTYQADPKVLTYIWFTMANTWMDMQIPQKGEGAYGAPLAVDLYEKIEKLSEHQTHEAVMMRRQFSDLALFHLTFFKDRWEPGHHCISASFMRQNAQNGYKFVARTVPYDGDVYETLANDFVVIEEGITNLVEQYFHTDPLIITFEDSH